MHDSLGITWPLATVSGYGIYGVEIAQSFFRRGGKKLALTKCPATLALPPLLELRLAGALALAKQFDHAIQQNPHETMSFDFPVLHGAGNDFAGFPGQDQVRGHPNIGCVAIEHLYCSAHGRAIGKSYDKLIAISQFNADYLRSLAIAPVYLCHQGIDSDLFFPQASRNLWPGRFIVFSGGKFEFRKGQDIMVAAFKRFAATHPDALLMCAWQSLGASDPAMFQAAGHIQTTPSAVAGSGLDIAGWLQQQGLLPHQFIALPFIHQIMMPSILRECAAAVFPNRCEGGTNLVAMEAIACGIPTYVAANTGQADLIEYCGALPLTHQKSCPVGLEPRSTTTQWGESDVEEIVAGLTEIYQNAQTVRQHAALAAKKISTWNWDTQNQKLFDALAA
jgi:glycosyltransferase involved in cell wall biosynthesis